MKARGENVSVSHNLQRLKQDKLLQKLTSEFVTQGCNASSERLWLVPGSRMWQQTSNTVNLKKIIWKDSFVLLLPAPVNTWFMFQDLLLNYSNPQHFKKCDNINVLSLDLKEWIKSNKHRRGQSVFPAQFLHAASFGCAYHSVRGTETSFTTLT